MVDLIAIERLVHPGLGHEPLMTSEATYHDARLRASSSSSNIRLKATAFFIAHFPIAIFIVCAY